MADFILFGKRLICSVCHEVNYKTDREDLMSGERVDASDFHPVDPKFPAPDNGDRAYCLYCRAPIHGFRIEVSNAN